MSPAKTQISLGIRPVWSESLLSAWRNLGSLATHWAYSVDSDQTGQIPRLIWVFAGHTVILLVLSWRRLKWCYGNFFQEHWEHTDQPCECLQDVSIVTIMSHVMRKPFYAICEHKRPRSDCASAQSDEHLWCLLLRYYNTYICYVQNFKTLTSFYSWACQFESYLVVNTWRCGSHVIRSLNKVLKYFFKSLYHDKKELEQPCYNITCP